jgi:hypothetical protein
MSIVACSSPRITDTRSPAGVAHRLDHLDDQRLGLRRQRPRSRAWRILRGVDAGAAAEDVDVEQRVGAEPVAAVHGHAGDLAGGVQPGDHRVVVGERLGSMFVGRRPSRSARSGTRDGLGVRLDAEVGAGELGDVRELGVDVRGLEVVRSSST